MGYLLLCLSLGFAAPAWANSLTETVCSEAPGAIAQMDGSQKLCRSFIMAQELGLGRTEVKALMHTSDAPTGYTWHHHQDVGRMQLVPFDAHRLAMPHTGGMAFWGGGHR